MAIRRFYFRCPMLQRNQCIAIKPRQETTTERRAEHRTLTAETPRLARKSAETM